MDSPSTGRIQLTWCPARSTLTAAAFIGSTPTQPAAPSVTAPTHIPAQAMTTGGSLCP